MLASLCHFVRCVSKYHQIFFSLDQRSSCNVTIVSNTRLVAFGAAGLLVPIIVWQGRWALTHMSNLKEGGKVLLCFLGLAGLSKINLLTSGIRTTTKKKGKKGKKKKNKSWSEYDSDSDSSSSDESSNNEDDEEEHTFYGVRERFVYAEKKLFDMPFSEDGVPASHVTICKVIDQAMVANFVRLNRAIDSKIELATSDLEGRMLESMEDGYHYQRKALKDAIFEALKLQVGDFIRNEHAKLQREAIGDIVREEIMKMQREARH